MAFDPRQHKFANNSWGRLSVGVGTGDSFLVIATGAGAIWPAISPGEIFLLKAVDPTSGSSEIMICNGISGASFTVERGQEGTTPKVLTAGSFVQHCVTAGILEWFEAQAV